MARNDSVYAEVTPVPENDLEILKLILVPYQGTIVRHYPERKCVLVELPDLSSLDALQQVPSYTTVMVDPPPLKQPDNEGATEDREGERKGQQTKGSSDDTAGDQRAATTTTTEASTVNEDRFAAAAAPAPEKERGETLRQREARQRQEGHVEPLHLSGTQEGLTQRRQGGSPTAATSSGGPADSRKQAPTSAGAMRTSPSEKGFSRTRKPLPANDIIYLFGDINIVAPAWCLFLVVYAIATLFGAL